MSQDIENELRRVLRAVDPGADFTARVMRALPARAAPAGVASHAASAPATGLRIAWHRLGIPAALAASLFMAFTLGRHVAMEHEESQRLAGLEASRQLMQALRVTSQKLDLAYEAVQRPSSGAPAAQENRS